MESLDSYDEIQVPKPPKRRRMPWPESRIERLSGQFLLKGEGGVGKPPPDLPHITDVSVTLRINRNRIGAHVPVFLNFAGACGKRQVG